MKFWWTIRGGSWRLYLREGGNKFSRSRTGSGKRDGLNHKSVVSGLRSIVPVNAGHVQSSMLEPARMDADFTEQSPNVAVSERTKFSVEWTPAHSH